MQHKNDGFVLAQILVFGTLLTVLPIALLRVFGGFEFGSANRVVALRNAERHMDGIDPYEIGTHRIDCERADVDQNGYVSCTGRLHDGQWYFFECTPCEGGCRGTFTTRTRD